MRMASLVHLAAGLTPERAREVLAVVCRAGEPETLEQFTERAAAAFELDMQPVCGAIVSALQGGNLQDFRDLRTLLPHLLRTVTREPALADLLALQLGKAFLDGFLEETEGRAQ